MLQAAHLLHAADYYDLRRLGEICEHVLCKSLSVDNAAYIMGLAHKYRTATLLRESLLLVASNVGTVMMTEEWAHIVLSNPQLKEAVRITRATGAPPEMQISSSADASGSTAGEPSAKRSRDG